jgi:hypothetical protein
MYAKRHNTFFLSSAQITLPLVRRSRCCVNTLWLWSVAKDLRRVTREMTDKGL